MTENDMVSKRIDITLDTKVLKMLDDIRKDFGDTRSGMIAHMITEFYYKK